MLLGSYINLWEPKCPSLYSEDGNAPPLQENKIHKARGLEHSRYSMKDNLYDADNGSNPPQNARDHLFLAASIDWRGEVLWDKENKDP